MLVLDKYGQMSLHVSFLSPDRIRLEVIHWRDDSVDTEAVGQFLHLFADEMRHVIIIDPTRYTEVTMTFCIRTSAQTSANTSASGYSSTFGV